MSTVFAVADNMITSLGFTTKENFDNLKAGNTGIRQVNEQFGIDDPVFASLVDSNVLSEQFSAIASPNDFTRFEQLAILSISKALASVDLDVTSERTLFILSTTKGNIDLLGSTDTGNIPNDRIYLASAAKVISNFFDNPNTPLVISNACISGVVALTTGARLIRAGKYDHAVVVGADIVSKFVVAGFRSLKALGNGPCKPYDKSRSGLSLGEGSGCVILSNEPLGTGQPIAVLSGASSNDANHISGPSRDGEGLKIAIEKTLKEAAMRAGAIDYVSTHGTATVYNDEMESHALARSGLSSTPINSLKGFVGHTLGAAGAIEVAAGLASMRENVLYPSLGFEELGVSNPINVISEKKEQEVKVMLKAASGFGGCNAAALFSKVSGS